MGWCFGSLISSLVGLLFLLVEHGAFRTGYERSRNNLSECQLKKLFFFSDALLAKAITDDSHRTISKTAALHLGTPWLIRWWLGENAGKPPTPREDRTHVSSSKHFQHQVVHGEKQKENLGKSQFFYRSAYLEWDSKKVGCEARVSAMFQEELPRVWTTNTGDCSPRSFVIHFWLYLHFLLIYNFPLRGSIFNAKTEIKMAALTLYISPPSCPYKKLIISIQQTPRLPSLLPQIPTLHKTPRPNPRLHLPSNHHNRRQRRSRSRSSPPLRPSQCRASNPRLPLSLKGRSGLNRYRIYNW